MSEPATIDPEAKPKRPRLQFGLGGLLLFVLFAGSVGLVVLRWERWAVERAVERFQRKDGAYMVLRGFHEWYFFAESAQARTLVNADTQNEISIPADECGIRFGADQFITIKKSQKTKIWDWNTGKSIELPGNIEDGCFTPDGKKLVAWDYFEVSSDAKALNHSEQTSIFQVFNSTNGSIIALRKFTRRSKVPTFSSDGTYAVLRFPNRECIVWNLIRDTIINAQDVLSFTADSKNIVCNTPSSGLAVLNADNGALVRQINSPEIVRAGRILCAFQDQLFVTGAQELYDANGTRTAVLRKDVSSDNIQISPDGRHLLVLVTKNGSGLEKTQICDLEGRLFCSFGYARFSLDGSKVYANSDDNMAINIWVQRFPDGPLGHFARPEVWLAIIFGSLWLWRASVWWRGRRDEKALHSLRFFQPMSAL